MGWFLFGTIRCANQLAANLIKQRLSHVTVEHVDGTLSKWHTEIVLEPEDSWVNVCPGNITKSGLSSDAENKRAKEFTNIFHGFLRNEANFDYGIVGVEAEQFRKMSEILADLIPDVKERPDAWMGLIISNDLWEKAGKPECFVEFSETHKWID